MADEESEIRRMAEIADAINAILDADPVGDTPTDKPPADQPNAAAPETVTPVTEAPAQQTAVPETDAAQPPAFDPPPADMTMPQDDTSTPAALSDDAAMATDNPMQGIDTSDLDAAIAAELNGEPEAATGGMNDDHFGPAPVIDFDAPPPRNDEIGRSVKDDSQLANLSIRMQDTLAEIRSGHLAHTAGRSDLIGKMEAAREEMMAQVRDKVDQMTADTQSRKQVIVEQIDQIEQQTMMFR